MEDMEKQVPENVFKAANYTMFIAIIACRKLLNEPDTGAEIAYEILDGIHEIPNILNYWGTSDNDIDKLRRHFSYFKHEKWKGKDAFVPDLAAIFDEKLNGTE